MVNLLVWVPVIPAGVETTSGVSSSVYLLKARILNYLAHVILGGLPH